ncbi:hypothetical protein [Ideonella sp. B508-1]|uniref:hypothetical protein n=1 Tax=Ideonella sp. B508-1 TaxID=137716 RepID=UPI00034A674B|nr:hypothetical protein [Ideonella sp. B508-1]
MKNLDALIDNGGSLGIGPMGSIECTATADDGHNAMAMLVRRDGESLNALLKRLDRAVGRFFEHDEITDEVNGP